MAIEHKDIAAIREDYAKGYLSEDEINKDPFLQFKRWFEQALEVHAVETNAMVLSTINESGFPSSRIVLLKDIKEDGFSFFTNYNSQKANDIRLNNKVSLLFFWPELQRQVRVEGLIEKVAEEDSNEYYASRPRDSRVGAWASPQSQVIDGRNFLDDQVEKYNQQFDGQDDIPRPDFWGGYIVKPVRLEFWQGRSSRLHDRLLYTKKDGNWTINRLAP